MQRRILIADDQKEGRQQLRSLFAGDDITVDVVDDAKSVLKALQDQNYSVALIDLATPGFDLKMIEDVHKRNLPVTMMILTDHKSIDKAVAAMRLGAYDFHTKPVDRQHLRLVVERVLRERRLQDEVVQLREQLQHRYSFHNIISKSPRMHAVFELICNVAQTSSTVLIEGETGTGKEKVAEAIHQASNVRTGSMIAVNCAAVPETLLESELFGHEKGAFTSAVSQKKGRFELADGGTIFLDEIGEMPLEAQTKLLRVLQEKEFERIGGTRTIKVNVRVIAATNRDLDRHVREKTFRSDLFYRLNVFPISVPPLRERREDIPLLARHFVRVFSDRLGKRIRSIHRGAHNRLQNYEWPGNVRELANILERAVIICPGAVLQEEHVTFEREPPETTTNNFPTMEEAERRLIQQAIDRTGGVLGGPNGAARLLGMNRSTLWSRMRKLGIQQNGAV